MTDLDKSKEIDALLKDLEPKLEKAFRQGLENLRDEVDFKAIERAIEQGDFDKAATLINEAVVATALIEYNKLIQDVVQAGGDIAAKWAKPVLVARLNVTETHTARFINEYQATRIRQVTEEVQRVVGDIILKGVTDGINPRHIAREIREYIGLTSRQLQAVDNYERLLREGDRQALLRALRDKRFDRTVINSIANKKPLTEEQIQRMKQRYTERYINYRATTIARTEAIMLVNQGQQFYWEQAIADGKVAEERLRKVWIPTYDGKLREAHAAIPRMNKKGVPFRESFQSPLGPIRFPGDPQATAANVVNCRCTTFTRIV